MPRVTFITAEGVERVVDAPAGASLMEVATKRFIPGIDAECGGACSCATCHVYIDEAWVDRLKPPGSLEESMLEFATDVASNSRLSCQVVVGEDLSGLVVRIPSTQG